MTSIQFDRNELTSNNTNYHTKMSGTVAWMAPEVMTNNYGFKAHVFSYGMVIETAVFFFRVVKVDSSFDEEKGEEQG